MRSFDQVTLELSEIANAKVRQYGNSRYEQHSDQFNYWMCFSDVHRKTLRLEELTRIALLESEGRHIARKKLIDDYKDIANYAIMAVQILEESDDEV